ncbi:MAG: ankyrin repeat domain-containing protein [Gammaproteobacteria bacterium]
MLLQQYGGNIYSVLDRDYPGLPKQANTNLTILHHAALAGREMVKYLLLHYKKPLQLEDGVRHPIYLAFCRGNVMVADLLLQIQLSGSVQRNEQFFNFPGNENIRSLLILGIECEQIKMVEWLLLQKADVNFKVEHTFHWQAHDGGKLPMLTVMKAIDKAIIIGKTVSRRL